MYKIKGRIQHYAWGGKTFLPSLLSIKNDDQLPFGEYWLGTHVSGPSFVHLSENATTPLPALIQSEKKRYLGENVTTQFNGLPFLFKILDVHDMLSIQVHPSKSSAEAGFEKENQLGIPLTAPNRNYKDQNHKPEVMVALSEFWLLHGFAHDIERRIHDYEILFPFQEDFIQGGIKGIYKKIMELPIDVVDEMLRPLSAQILDSYHANLLEKTSPDFWAARAMETFKQEDGHFDKGIFSIYLFNILCLSPGQAIFQGAGMPHAYLEGQNIELMSNSDNVLRAGLTPKHIDIPELLSNTAFVPTIPSILKGELGLPHQVYHCPINDFILYADCIQAGEERVIPFTAPGILLVMEGSASWSTVNASIDTIGLDSLFVSAGEELKVKANSKTSFFIATVPSTPNPQLPTPNA